MSLAIGLWMVYVVWSRQPGLQVPPGVGYLAAGTFLSAGLALFFQSIGLMRAATVPAALTAATLAGIGGWIGFGSGSRRCTGSLSGLELLPSEWTCRFVFGAGAVFTAGIVLLMLRSLLRPGSGAPAAGGQTG